jgi:hypothetical protein
LAGTSRNIELGDTSEAFNLLCWYRLGKLPSFEKFNNKQWTMDMLVAVLVGDLEFQG